MLRERLSSAASPALPSCPSPIPHLCSFTGSLAPIFSGLACLYPVSSAKEALCGLLWEVTLDPPGPGLGPSPTTPNLGPYHSAPLSIFPSGAMAGRDAVSSTGSQQIAPGTSRCLLDRYFINE